MWFVYALTASIIWGISYAASGRVIERGISPLNFFFLYALTGCLASGAWIFSTGKMSHLPAEIRTIGTDWVWLLISVATSAAGALLIYIAIGEKNATLASLIEISYPLFVAFFAWLFFRETQFNLATIVGASLIIGGVMVVYLGNRGES